MKEEDIKIETAETIDNQETKDKKAKKKKPSQQDELKNQITDLSDKLASEKDAYLRLMAEFETYRRRTSEERLNLVATAAADTIKGLLPVLDDCERALSILDSSSDEAAKEGTKLIYENLLKYLNSLGLEQIKAKGETFNTDFHEAVAQFPAGEDMKDKVFDVVQQGYLFKGKILRFAKVVVGI